LQIIAHKFCETGANIRKPRFQFIHTPHLEIFTHTLLNASTNSCKLKVHFYSYFSLVIFAHKFYEAVTNVEALILSRFLTQCPFQLFFLF
jgi:hypothetical protein